MSSQRFHPFALLIVFLLYGSTVTVQAQSHSHSHHSETNATSSGERQTVLKAPGHSVFGAVQETIRRLEADSTTDWSEVDVEALRQHLIDMEQVAMNVVVEDEEAIQGGVRLQVRPTNEAARASLERVLAAHPRMLRRTQDWTMQVKEQGSTYVVRVTTDDPGESDKIRGLGYMGLLAYGMHHQRHHWQLVRGKDPHASGSH